MSSFLSFVWKFSSKKKQRRTGKKQVKDTSEEIPSKNTADTVPDVAPSSSCEEHFSPTLSMIDEKLSDSMKCNASINDDYKSFFTALTDDSSKSFCMDDTVELREEEGATGPPTPEGLEPRKSMAIVRSELGIPSVMRQTIDENKNPKKKYIGESKVATATAATTTTLKLSSPTTLETKGGSFPLLPPYLKSYDTHSPQISNASFYSRGTSYDNVAASPDFAAPVTAVGALVATTNYTTSHDDKLLSSLHSLARKHNYNVNPEPTSSFDVLPPSDWIKRNEDEYIEEESEIIYPYAQLHCGNDDDDDDDDDSSKGYGRRLFSKGFASDNNYQQGCSSITSNCNSQVGSQVGLVEQQQQQGQQQQPFQRGAYNFDPILNLNVSAITGQTDDQSSLHSLGDYPSRKGGEDVALNKCNNFSQNFYSSLDEEEEFDSLFIKRKQFNQKCNKEKLVLDCIARLQSNGGSAITEILVNSSSSKKKDDNSLDTRFVDQNGLLQGMSTEMIHRISHCVGAILLEMETSSKEEIFFVNSTQQEESDDETHTDLKLALQFIKEILISQRRNKMHNWTIKQQIRSELENELSVKSPEKIQRGGDTSVFTLPEESDTPYTSNLSMATTITSKQSTPVNIAYSCGGHLAEIMSIQQTVRILCTLLRRMTEACRRLLETDCTIIPEVIRATEDIKLVYLQILSIKESDLRTLSESFIQQPPLLVRTVSVEDEQLQEQQQQQQHKQPSQDKEIFRVQTMTRQSSSTYLQPLSTSSCQETITSTFITTSTRIEEEDNEEDDDGEDLRRQIGSNDYDCDDFRDGPEEIPSYSEINQEERDVIRDFYQRLDTETMTALASCRV